MDTRTFDIKTLKDGEKYGKNLARLTQDEAQSLQRMNRKERREWLKNNRKFKSGKWGFAASQ